MRAFLARRWFVIALVWGGGIGVTWPAPLVPITRPLPPHLVVGLSLFIMAWTMPSHSFRAELTWPWPAAWAVFLSYSFLPALGWLLGFLSPLPDLRVGLLLAASVP